MWELSVGCVCAMRVLCVHSVGVLRVRFARAEQRINHVTEVNFSFGDHVVRKLWSFCSCCGKHRSRGDDTEAV